MKATRLSLAKKINYCLTIGSLKTFSLDEAILLKDSLNMSIDEIIGHYNNGLMLNCFEVYKECEDKIHFVKVEQFNTLPKFVENIVSYALKNN